MIAMHAQSEGSFRSHELDRALTVGAVFYRSGHRVVLDSEHDLVECDRPPWLGQRS